MRILLWWLNTRKLQGFSLVQSLYMHGLIKGRGCVCVCVCCLVIDSMNSVVLNDQKESFSILSWDQYSEIANCVCQGCLDPVKKQGSRMGYLLRFFLMFSKQLQPTSISIRQSSCFSEIKRCHWWTFSSCSLIWAGFVMETHMGPSTAATFCNLSGHVQTAVGGAYLTFFHFVKLSAWVSPTVESKWYSLTGKCNGKFYFSTWIGHRVPRYLAQHFWCVYEEASGWG